MRPLAGLAAVLVMASAGCLYKSGGKYAGTFGVTAAEVTPAQPTTADEVVVSLTVRFTGKATASAPTVRMRVTVDDSEPRIAIVPLTFADGNAVRVAEGNAKVALGTLAAGAHAIAVVVVAPPGLKGGVLPALVRTVNVLPAQP